MVDIVVDGNPRAAVLRLPTAASGPRAISTQRAALEAVASSTVPAPRLLWFDDGEQNPFGCPFIVMERLPGDVPVGWHELPEPRRTALAEDAIDVLVRLHAVDVDRTQVGKTTGSPLMDLDGLQRLFARLAPLPSAVTTALWWLGRHRPSTVSPRVIVHGDYRMGNFVVEGERISGVLDWEMAAPGEALVDLAWCFIPVFELPGVDEVAMVSRYAARTGLTIDPQEWHWHRLLGYTRLAYYALAGTRAFDAGRSADLRLAALRLQLPVTLDRLAATLTGEAPR